MRRRRINKIPRTYIILFQKGRGKVRAKAFSSADYGEALVNYYMKKRRQGYKTRWRMIE
jgi:hypothetical protein